MARPLLPLPLSLLHFTGIQSYGYTDQRKVETDLGPVVQKPINTNPALKVNQGVYFFSPRGCSTLIFSKTLHEKKSTLKNKNKQKKLRQKVENMKQKFTLILD